MINMSSAIDVSKDVPGPKWPSSACRFLIGIFYFTFFEVEFIYSVSGVQRSCCCSVAKLFTTSCDPMDYNPPDPSVHGISQARMLQWVAISFSNKVIQI